MLTQETKDNTLPAVSVVTKALVPEAKTEAPGFEAKTEAVASETKAVDRETKAKAARQLIAIGYSIPINIKYTYIAIPQSGKSIMYENVYGILRYLPI